jgi:hypothetical protein
VVQAVVMYLRQNTDWPFKSSLARAHPLSHLAPDASRVAGASARGAVQGNRHSNCY